MTTNTTTNEGDTMSCFSITHNHTAGGIRVTIPECYALDWDYAALPPVLRFRLPRLGDHGFDVDTALRGEVPIDRVLRVVRPDEQRPAAPPTPDTRAGYPDCQGHPHATRDETVYCDGTCQPPLELEDACEYLDGAPHAAAGTVTYRRPRDGSVLEQHRACAAHGDQVAAAHERASFELDVRGA